jgi:hypothetical protein
MANLPTAYRLLVNPSIHVRDCTPRCAGCGEVCVRDTTSGDMAINLHIGSGCCEELGNEQAKRFCRI